MGFGRKQSRRISTRLQTASKPAPVDTVPDVVDPKRKKTPTKYGGLLERQADVAHKTLLGH